MKKYQKNISSKGSDYASELAARLRGSESTKSNSVIANPEKYKEEIRSKAREAARIMGSKIRTAEGSEKLLKYNDDAIRYLDMKFKTNNAYEIGYTTMAYLEENMISAKDIITTATKYDAFVNFIVALVMIDFRLHDEVVEDYLDYYIEPLEYEEELLYNLAKMYANDGIVYSSWYVNIDGLIERSKDKLKLAEKVHKYDCMDMITSKISKKYQFKKESNI